MVPLPGRVTEDRPSVLIVDDLWSNLELLEVIFANAGFEVFSALGASSALSIFDSHKIDIAILDVMMPGMDGFELCKQLKSLAGKRFFPIVLLTALTDRQSRITGLECGADDFISKPFDPTELTVKVRSLTKLKALQDELEHSENVILTLAVALESRDPYTRGHSTRVGDISVAFSSFLGLSRKEQEQIRKGGILHDIGKIGVRTDLICKDGRLSGEELEEVKRHTVIGEEICRPLVSVRGILPVIRSHHERWDGRGFPDGLCGEEIPLSARMLAIADSFDAMVSKRPYRNGRSTSAVMAVFLDEKQSGQWDPKLVERFVEMITLMEQRGGEPWLSLQ